MTICNVNERTKPQHMLSRCKRLMTGQLHRFCGCTAIMRRYYNASCSNYFHYGVRQSGGTAFAPWIEATVEMDLIIKIWEKDTWTILLLHPCIQTIMHNWKVNFWLNQKPWDFKKKIIRKGTQCSNLLSAKYSLSLNVLLEFCTCRERPQMHY